MMQNSRVKNEMRENQPDPSCLIVGNYCHDVLIKEHDGVKAESLGGAASFISAVLDGLSIPSFYVSKVGSDFSYSVNQEPIICPTSKTTLFHAHFSSTQERVLKRVRACDSINPSDLPPESKRFNFGLAVGVAGEILPETLERLIDICDVVFVDIQALIRVFDAVDGTVRLIHLKDTGFYHLLPRIGFLKASSEEAPYLDVEEARKKCCVVVTKGKDGCTVYWKDGEQRIAPFPTVQVDPTGAGDSFLGGLVAGLVQGLPVADAALLGNFFGSLTVGQIGLPKYDSRLLQRVKDEAQKRSLQRIGHPKGQDKGLIFTKPLNHEEFLTALNSSRLLPPHPIRGCQLDFPTPCKAIGQCIPRQCSDQPKLLSTTRYEESFESADGIP